MGETCVFLEFLGREKANPGSCQLRAPGSQRPQKQIRKTSPSSSKQPLVNGVLGFLWFNQRDCGGVIRIYLSNPVSLDWNTS